MSILQRMRRGLGSVILGVCAACLVLGTGVQPAQAQVRMGMGAGAGGFMSAITSRELDKWAEMLNLTQDQKDVAKTLHQAYMEEHSQQSKALQDLMKSAQAEFMESKDMSAFKEMGEKTQVINDKMTSGEKQFLDDVKAILDPKQLEQWPRVERHHRRVKSLPGGMLSGESANLVSVVEDLKIASPSPELKDELLQYEMDLDKAMTDRDVKRKEMEKQSQEMMKDFDPSKMDFTKIRQMMQDARKSGIPVRDINQRHARLLAGVVPADKKADFEERARKALYPEVYKPPFATKAITAALAMDDLTTDQKTQVEQLKESFTRDLAAANEKWAAGIAEEEKDGGGDPFGGFGKMVPGGGGDEKSPAEDAKKARRSMAKAAVEKLKSILTDDQKAKLPEPDNDNPWAMNFGGGGDEAADEKPAPKAAKPDKKK